MRMPGLSATTLLQLAPSTDLPDIAATLHLTIDYAIVRARTLRLRLLPPLKLRTQPLLFRLLSALARAAIPLPSRSIRVLMLPRFRGCYFMGCCCCCRGELIALVMRCRIAVADATE